jgi:ubiquinone/menaquinone biosynthesis C-methylase UbiE
VTAGSREHFDQLAERYVELRAAPGFGDPVTEAVVEIARLRSGDVLDVGCGPGTVVGQLARRFDVTAVGVDVSRPMIDVARREVPEASFHVAAAEDLPFAEATFDAVVMRMVVHHLDRPRAFAEMRRVLRPSGRLAITTTDPSGFESFWMKPFFPSYVRIERARFPEGEVLRRELGDAGFEDARIHRLGIERRFSRDEAMQKLRGRGYSTFTLMTDAEYKSGVDEAERRLPPEIVYELRLLNVVATRP